MALETTDDRLPDAFARRRANMFRGTRTEPRAANTALRIGEIENAVAMYFRTAASDPRIAQLARRIHGEVASLGLSHLENNPTFLSIIHRYEGEARDLGLTADPAARERAILANANVTDAQFANAVQRLPGGRYNILLTGGPQEGTRERPPSYGDLASQDLSRITPANYSHTPYAGVGISFQTFSDLRGQGFGHQQIMAAAGLTREFGINTNSNVAAVARLQRDIPGINDGLRTIHGHNRAIYDLERQRREALQRGDTTAAQALQRQIEQRERQRREAEERERDRVRRINPDRLPDLDNTLRAMRQASFDVRTAPSGPGATAPATGPRAAPGATRAALAEPTSSAPQDLRSRYTAEQRRVIAARQGRNETVAATRSATQRIAIRAQDDDILADIPASIAATTTPPATRATSATPSATPSSTLAASTAPAISTPAVHATASPPATTATPAAQASASPAAPATNPSRVASASTPRTTASPAATATRTAAARPTGPKPA